MAVKKRGLGRGLDALLSGPTVSSLEEQAVKVDQSELQHLPLDLIQRGKYQPRRDMDPQALEELASSIRTQGVMQPIVVRPIEGNRFEIIAGERRWRASQQAGKDTIPAMVKDVPDETAIAMALIENIQREDLNPIELARGYKQLIEQFHWTQEELADQVGKKRATVTNTLRLLNLPEVVQARVADGSIAMGHARALLAIDSPQKQIAACRKIVSQGMSVRQVEKMASHDGAPSKPTAPKDPNITVIEDELRRKLGTKVALRTSGSTKGKIEIEYFNLDELDRLLGLIRSIR